MDHQLDRAAHPVASAAMQPGRSAGSGVITAPPAAGVGPCRLRMLQWVHAWLAPWSVLGRCWRAWSTAPPPRELQALLDWVAAADRSTSITHPNNNKLGV